MSIAEQITRINQEKKKIGAKTTEFGLTDNDTVNLETLADAISGIVYRGAISVNVKEKQSYTLEPGYYKAGTIYAVNNPDLDEEEFKLQTGVEVKPTVKDQTISPSEGFYGLGAVTVKAIPHPYHDVSNVDAVAGNVLVGKKFVTADGTLTIGEMLNRGAVTQELSGNVLSYDIKEGYHSGKGKVYVSGTTRAKPVLSTSIDEEDNDLIIKATSTQEAGYVTAGTETSTNLYVMASVNGKTVTVKTSVSDDSISRDVADGAYSASVSLTAGDGSVAVSPSNNVGLTEVEDAPTTGFYITATGSGSVSGKGTATVDTNGYVEKGSKNSQTSSQSSNTATKYYKIQEGSCIVSGGGLTKGDGSVSATGTNITLTEETEEPTSGYYITAIGSGTVNRAAITKAQFSGYIPPQISTTVNDATSESSNDAAKYYTIATESQSVTPSAQKVTVTPNNGKLLSSVEVFGDSNLKEANIKSGEKIFGVTGSFTSDATATAAHILSGETAYANGSKVTGNMKDHGTVTAEIDGMTVTSYTLSAGYTGGLTVTLTKDIENELAAI